MACNIPWPAWRLAVMIPNTLHGPESKDVKIVASLDNWIVPIRLKKEDSGAVIRNAEELVAHSSKPHSPFPIAWRQAPIGHFSKRAGACKFQSSRDFN